MTVSVVRVPGSRQRSLVRPVKEGGDDADTSVVRLAVDPGRRSRPGGRRGDPAGARGRAGAPTAPARDHELDWGGERFLREGAAMPRRCGRRRQEASTPCSSAPSAGPTSPTHELVWGLIIGLRQQLDLAVNIRPVRAFPGVPHQGARHRRRGPGDRAGEHRGRVRRRGRRGPRRDRTRPRHRGRRALAPRHRAGGAPCLRPGRPPVGSAVPGDQVQRDALRLPAVGRGGARGRRSSTRRSNWRPCWSTRWPPA